MRLSLLAGCLLLALPAAAAQEGAAFLRVPAGARPMALGEAYTAVADDLNSLGTNPAGLAVAAQRQAAFSHAELLAGSRYDFAGYSHPLAPGDSLLSGGTIGVGLQRLSHGALSGRDESGRPTGDFAASDTAVSLAYSRRLAPRLVGGASVKFVDSRLADSSARTLALDVGVQRPLSGSPVTLGLAVLNVGRGLRFGQETSPLPLTVSLGASARLAGAFLLAADVRHRPNDRRTSYGIGTEYALASGLALRAGYAARAAGGGVGTPAAGVNGLGLGFGLRVFRASLDYAFSPYGELGAAQRITLSTRF